MRAWWEARSRREQLLLAVMAASLAAFLLWFGLHRPAAQAREAAAQRHERALKTQAMVEAAVGRIRRLQRGGVPAVRRAPPAEAVNASAAAAGLTLSRVSPDPAGGVQVAVGGVSPGKLLPWLASLQQEYGLAARHLTIVKDETGSLSMDATFSDEAG